MQKQIPGTNKILTSETPFKEFEKMIELTDGITLSQVCSITGLDQFVIQNWVKRGYVARPIKKKYYAKQLARILMINSLKDAMKIEEIGELMTLINGDVEDESDDLLSESKLYSLFAKVIYNLDDRNQIDKVINEVLKNSKIEHDKLFIALEIIVNGYMTSEYKKKTNNYLKMLKNIQKEN